MHAFPRPNAYYRTPVEERTAQETWGRNRTPAIDVHLGQAHRVALDTGTNLAQPRTGTTRLQSCLG
jgi:hypothetical protein